MSRTTCRPRLRQRLRRGANGFIFLAAMCLGLMVTSVRGVSATNAPVPKTGQTTSYASYDDGWYSTNVGVARPNPRFTTNGIAADSNCVTDKLTGLMWLKNPDATTRIWVDAITYCEGLDGANGRGGYTDWRLPNKRELLSLIDDSRARPALPGHPFTGVQSADYWSSTTYAGNTVFARYVYLANGNVGSDYKTSAYYVWPVRGVSLDSPAAPVPKTGQTTSYASYDDGWYSTNVGMAWPNPRFTEGTGTSSDCVTDNLTGLMWLKNPDATGRTWTNAITYCEGLDGANGRGGYTDWRLPNKRELLSLIDDSQARPALPAGHPFTGIQLADYWSSTSGAGDAGGAWSVHLYNGYLYYGNKTPTYSYYVWPVRGGQ